MIYDRLGVPITEGAILYNISRCNCECTLLAVTGVRIVGDRSGVDGIVLEWKWGFFVGEVRCWSVFRHGVLNDHEIVGWCPR